MANDDTVEVKFSADTSGVNEAAESVKNEIADIGKSAEQAGKLFDYLAERMAEAFAIHEIVEFAGHMSELGEQAIRTSEMLGIGIEQVQELGFAARMVGGSSDGMNIALERLERNMADISNPTSIATKAFQSLGISELDIKDKSPDQVLGLIADKFHNAADGAGKTAISMDLMGRSGANMIPLLNQGREGLEKMGLIAVQTGSVLSGELAEAFEQTHQKIIMMTASTEGTKIALMEELRPAIDNLIEGLTEFWQEMDADISKGGVFHEAIVQIVDIFEILIGTLKTVGIALGTVGALAYDAAHGNFKDMGNVVADSAAKIEAAWGKIDVVVQTVNGNIQASIAKTNEAVKSQLTAPSTGSGDAKSQIEAQMEAYQEKIRILALELSQEKEIDAAKVDLHKMTALQEVDDLKAATRIKYDMMIDELEQEKNIGGLTVAQQQKIDDQIETLQEQLQLKLLQLKVQEAKAEETVQRNQTAIYRNLFNQIGSGFDTMINGVLQGTQTWSQAMGKLFDDIAIKAIEAIAKIIAEWLVFEVVTEGQGTWGDFMTLEGSGKAGIGDQVFGALKSYDVGSWNIPSDTAAMVHQGEMIIPAAQASAIRSGSASVGGGAASGNSNITFNVSAIDAQGVSQFFNGNAGLIAKAVASQMRQGNPALTNLKS